MMPLNLGRLLQKYGLLRWQRYLPGLFILIAFTVLLRFEYPWDSHQYDLLLELGCILVLMVGFVIRALAIGYTPQQTPAGLWTKGMYSLLQHPLYVGNFFLGLAPVLFLHTWWLILLYAAFFVLYYQEIIKDETSHLKELFGSEYRNWVRQTSAFFPKTFRWQQPDIPFSWKTVIRREYIRFFGFILLMTMMEHFGDVVIYGTFVFDAAWTFIFLASAGVGLFVYSAIGTVLLCMTVLLVFMGTPRRAMGQHSIPQAVSVHAGHDAPPLPPLSFEPSKYFDFDSTSRQSSALQQPTKPPQWDFSVPRFQSFHRRKAADYDSLHVSFRFDPSETWSAGCLRRTKREAGKIRSDFRNFYSCDNVANIGIGYGVHAVISNTPMDQCMTDWYQQNVRSSGLDKLSTSAKLFGEPEAIMLIAGVSILYYSDKITDRVRLFETPVGSGIGKFASQTTRAFLVGTPTLWLSQSLIGAGRPNFTNPSSRWQPFVHANGVSGHAFVGAMPFITLAQMSDNFWLKTTFYTCSTFTAWSRLNDDRHYLSQCMLGWYFAYLSCRAVSKTEYQFLPRGLTVFPIMEPRTSGIGFVYQW